MAHSSSEQIELKEKNIAKERAILTKNYESLGKNVALFICDNSFPYCPEELLSYEIAKGEYKRFLKAKDKLKSKVDALNECKSEINSLRKKLLEKKEEENNELSKFGAAIFEAYTNQNLADDLVIKLDSIFSKTNDRIKRYSMICEKSNIILISAFYEKLLNRQKKLLLNQFIEASLLVLKEKIEDTIIKNNNEKYVRTLKNTIKSRESLEKQLNDFELKIEEIKKEDPESPSRKLEEIKKELMVSKEAENKAAILLGEELYNKLPNDISSNEIGAKAISLIDEITLELAKIESLEQDIIKLNNEIYITELSAQIAHERSKITKLQDEILNCNKQINKIETIINKKRDKIIDLKKAGTFEESKLDLITLDDTDGNT